MKNEEITWYKNRIIKLVKESEDLRLLKLIHRIAENLLGTVKERYRCWNGRRYTEDENIYQRHSINAGYNQIHRSAKTLLGI